MANISLKTLSSADVELLVELTSQETNAVLGGNWISTAASIGAGLTAAGSVFTGIATIGTILSGSSGAGSGSGAAASPVQSYVNSEIYAALAEPDWNPITNS